MKSLHLSLNIAHSGCKPSTLLSSSTHSFQVFLFLPLHLAPPPPLFYRPIPNLHPESPTLSSIHPHPCRSILIHSLYHRHYPFIYTQISQCPPNHLPWHPIKGFLQIHKSHPQVFTLRQVFLLQLTDYEISICRAPACHKSKLHTVNSHNPSQSSFNHSFQNLHCMFQQLYAPVWATCQWITHPYLCKHSPSNSCSSPPALYHPSPQHYTHQSSTMYPLRWYIVDDWCV